MKITFRTCAAAAAAVFCLGLTACTTGSEAQRESCSAGTYVRCTCGDGRQGEAACNTEGTGFEACACAASTCMPGSVSLCACPANAIGHAVCDAQGSAYGTCECDSAPACTAKSLAVCTCSDGRSGTTACHEDGSGYGDCSCVTPLLCTPSSLAVCACPDGGQGEASCAADGASFGVCDCSDPQVCTPTSTVACSCGDGGQGRSACNELGTGFGECECEAPPACEPGTAVGCRCGDAGVGLMVCNANGSGYEACQCDGPQVCAPSSTLGCACGDGGVGQARCNAQGTGYAPCDCSTRICTPGMTTPCACTSGAAGRATCNTQGTAWSSCSCTVPRTCVAGTIGLCECADGRGGQAQCNGNGDGYLACSCDGCTPGNVAVCNCASGAMGQMVCGAAGEYGACRCDARACFPGDLALCSCDGGTGARACNADGTGFLPCQCGAPLTCIPASKAACTCADGASGQATCSAAGDGFAACDCSAARCTPGTRKPCSCQDGATGIATCSPDGSDFGACACEPPCGTLRASGVLHTSAADLSMWGFAVTPNVVHRLDSDATDDGCIGEAKFTVGATKGCTLTLEFGRLTIGYSTPTPYGGLRKVSFAADSYCPGFTGGGEGTYSSTAGFLPGWYEGPTQVSDRLASTACFRSTSIGFTDHLLTLGRADGRLLTLNLKDLVLTGDLSTTGSSSMTCFERDACEAPMYDGGGGWCVSPCSTYDYHCTVNCAVGFRDGGDRTCVAAGACADGYWDGGQGKCILAGTCALGYHDDGTGVCTTVPGCISGYHDGGDGNCVPEGECAPTFGHDAYGYCKRWVSVAAPIRPTGYSYNQVFNADARLESGRVLGLSPASAQLFTPGTQAWSAVAAPPVSRNRHQAVPIAGDRAFVLGLAEPYNGYGTPVNIQTMIYDATSNTWATAPAPAVPDRSDPCTVALDDGKVLMVGGHKSEQRAEIFDPATSTWQFAGALSLARRTPGCTRLSDGRVLVCGGNAQQTECSYYNSCAASSCEVFDPADLSWTAAGAMKWARSAHSMAPLGSTRVLIVAGGADQAELYDVATGRSVELVEGPRYTRMTVPMGSDRLFVLSSSRSYLVEQTGTSTVVRDLGPLLNSADYARAVMLEDGRILLFDQDSADLFIGQL